MKILLFDADGVLTLPEDFFSVVYANSHGLDPEPFKDFFKNEWHDYVIGKKDIKDHIRANPDLWQWDGNPDELMDYWCKTEDVRNQQLIDTIHALKTKGIPCYLATEQEQHRGRHMKQVMFPDLFDGYFITAEIGYKKSNTAFFEAVIDQLAQVHGTINREDILFFDDSQSKIDAAVESGLTGYLYTSITSFKEALSENNIPIPK